MRRRLCFLLAAGCCALLSACFSAGKAPDRGVASAVVDSFQEERPLFEYQVLDYQGKNRGMPVPDWARIYLAGGVWALEQQAEAQRSTGGGVAGLAGKYLFVSAQKSVNLAALLQWKNSFSGGIDFSLMVFPRVYRRLVLNVPVNPEQWYGSFFGLFMRAAADASWPDAALADSVWLTLRMRAAPNDADASADAAPLEETNMVLTLAALEKSGFERELGRILDHIPRDRKQTSDQRSAISRLKSSFFSNF